MLDSGDNTEGMGYNCLKTGKWISTEPMGLFPKQRQETFHHHTYDLIKKKDQEIEELKKYIEDTDKAVTLLGEANRGLHSEAANDRAKIKSLEAEIEFLKEKDQNNILMYSNEVKELNEKLGKADILLKYQQRLMKEAITKLQEGIL